MTRTTPACVTMLLAATVILTAAGCQKDTAAEQAVLMTGPGQYELFWQADVDLNKDTGEQFRDAYLRGDQFYALTTDNRLVALDAFSGQYLWSAPLGSPHLMTSDVARQGDAVFVSVLNVLHAISAVDGSHIDRRKLDRAPSTALVASDRFVYFGCHDGWFEAVAHFPEDHSWDRRTASAIMAGPAHDRGRVFFANLAGQVFASSDDHRGIHWITEVSGAVEAGLRVTDAGLLIVASRDYTVYGINPNSGGAAWRITTGDPLQQTPLVHGNRVYVVKMGGQMLAIDGAADAGRTLWSYDGVDAPVAADDEVVVVRTDKAFKVLSAATGKVLSKIGRAHVGEETESRLASVMFARNDDDGRVFLATPGGKVYLLQPASDVTETQDMAMGMTE